MLGPLGGWEIAVIALVIILIFGAGKISGLGRDLGGSIKEFRRAVKEDDEEEQPTAADTTVHSTTQQPPAAPPPAPAQPTQPSSSSGSGDQNKPNIF